jgi:hypothetical protein
MCDGRAALYQHSIGTDSRGCVRSIISCLKCPVFLKLIGI